VENLSFFEAVRRFPGALVRLPSTAIDTLDAINALTERIDRLMTLLEQFEGGMHLAGSGVDFATTGIAQAVAGLQQAMGSFDNGRPPFSQPAEALRNLAERLGGTSAAGVEIVVTSDADDEDFDPLDEEPPFMQFEAIVTELARLVESLVSSIPGVREFLRLTTSPGGGVAF
jgi:hypothetical protein